MFEREAVETELKYVAVEAFFDVLCSRRWLVTGQRLATRGWALIPEHGPQSKIRGLWKLRQHGAKINQ